MGKWRTAIACSVCWAVFSRYCGHRTMTIKGAKRNVPHLLQAQQAPICLWSISETLQCQKFRGTVTNSTVSNRECWSLKVLWGSVRGTVTKSTVSSRVCWRLKVLWGCACSRGGALFLPYRIQPHL